MANPAFTYAIAVREADGLYLVATVVRDIAGDVYVNWPRPYRPDMKPHTSYHASGQHHHKTFKAKGLLRKDQPPDKHFSGERNIVTFGVDQDMAKAVGVLCKESEYSAVFEIPSSQLGTTKYATAVSVDLADEGGRPIIPAGAVVLKAVEYKDASRPRILVTLFDAANLT